MAMAECAADPPLSERLLESLRAGNLAPFHEGPPCAAALPVLLEALGWEHSPSELAEALPHFRDCFELSDLRHVLLALGYLSEPMQGRVRDLNLQLYPGLFVSRTRLLVLIERQGEEVWYFDAHTGRDTKSEDVLEEKGTIYTFTRIDLQPGDGVQDLQESWMRRLGKRFRGYLGYLLSMTLLINLVSLTVPLAVMLVYDKVIGSRSEDTLFYLVAGVAIALCVDYGLRLIRARLLGTVAGRIDYLIGTETLRQILSIPPLYTEQSPVAAQLVRLKQFDMVRNFLAGNMATVILELPFIALSVLVIALLAGSLAWVIAATILVFLLIGLALSDTVCDYQRQYGEIRSRKQNMFLQTLEGLLEIKSAGARDVWMGRFREISGEHSMAAYKSAVASAAASALGQLVMSFSILATITWGTFLVMANQLSIGALIAVMALSWRTLVPLQQAYLGIPLLRQVRKAVAQINQLMQIEKEQRSDHTAALLSDIKGRVIVDRVVFRYAPDQDPALLGVSFTAHPGELIAITGSTGSGKSTLLKLIAGMYRQQAGAIFLDRVDIRQIDPLTLRRNIAYVPQDIRMFHGTIAQNLRLNNPLADRMALEKALREAGVLDDVLALPQGLETRIGDNVTLHFPSGFIHGLALARALVRPAPLLLMDEPAASLDMQADQALMDTLRRMRGKRTIIMVSHRPSHIRMADKAVYMHQGTIQFVGAADKVVAKLLEQST